jgi:Ca2+-binding EF-hand superfamily protein
MRQRPGLLGWFLAASLAALLTATAGAAADNDDAGGAKKPDPPGTALIMGQLRALFAAWDLDKDGYLDKEELAKAFRGPKAKPFDYKAPSKDAKDKDTDKDTSKDAKDKDTSKDAKKPDYSAYPDYQFLVQLDTDGDEKISRDEFESWARDYAVQLKKIADTQTLIAQAEVKLQGNLSKQERKQVLAELKRQKAALAKLNKGLKAYDTQLQKAMKGVKKPKK